MDKLLLERGKRLAKEGANHLAYVRMLEHKEYDLDFTTRTLGEPNQKDIEEAEHSAIFDAMMDDLREHKTVCSGCSATLLQEAKDAVAFAKHRVRHPRR
jgi:hypothetical protein